MFHFFLDFARDFWGFLHFLKKNIITSQNVVPWNVVWIFSWFLQISWTILRFVVYTPTYFQCTPAVIILRIPFSRLIFLDSINELAVHNGTITVLLRPSNYTNFAEWIPKRCFKRLKSCYAPNLALLARSWLSTALLCIKRLICAAVFTRNTSEMHIKITDFGWNNHLAQFLIP